MGVLAAAVVAAVPRPEVGADPESIPDPAVAEEPPNAVDFREDPNPGEVLLRLGPLRGEGRSAPTEGVSQPVSV